MQPERIEKVKSLIAAALSRRPDEREPFLDEACAGDLELRHEVDRYLHGGQKTEAFFNQAETLANAPISLENPSAQTTVSFETDSRICREFGRYQIKQRIAEGGMGVVYLALDKQLGREVALKILPEYFSMDGERLSRFQREARTTSLLNHPNIVTVFEIGKLDGCEFIVTEYVEGKTLREMMCQGPIPFVEMLKIASQIASALAAAHKAGIIHRDIKPENVMIRPDGYVKVLDFGLAKLTDSAYRTTSGGIEFGVGTVNTTIPGMIMGTVSYMSPEQAEGLEIDATTDIWALGAILYEMVAGKVPFKGPTPSHTIVAILEREPEIPQHVSPELRQIIVTALQKNRSQRFQSAEEMGSAIDDLKHRLGYNSDKNVLVTAPTEKIVASVTKEAPRPSRRLLWIVPAVLAVLLVGVVGIVAAVSWLIDSSRAGSVEPSTANVATPTPANVGISVASPSPDANPTPEPSYVAPTPEPTVASTPAERQSVRQQPVESQRQPTRSEPKKKPVRKPTQDPNCVFTNTCK